MSGILGERALEQIKQLWREWTAQHAEPLPPRNPRSKHQKKFAKSNSAISKGAYGSVTIWTGPLNSETDSGITVTALNRFGEIESAGLWLTIERMGGDWVITLAECD